ncbi:MAG: ComF family protein [Firmicutes bacterium]|jgi:ComF family protein|nr:ComF family protein [Candidatus Fermentithermobacillaceae bacterium]
MANTCNVCGIPIPPPFNLCETCRKNLCYFDAGKSAGIYGGLLKNAIVRMKYYKERWLSRPLGRLLSEAVVFQEEIDMLVPIPLEPSSMQKRGYNQAKDLAIEVSSKIKLPVFDILIREGKKDRQAKLNRVSRWENLRGTMTVRSGYQLMGATVVLVDDVTTTGATLDEGARALKEAGAQRVLCATLARTAKY